MKYKIQHLPLFCQAPIKTDGITQSKSICFPSIPNEGEGRPQQTVDGTDSGLCYNLGQSSCLEVSEEQGLHRIFQRTPWFMSYLSEFGTFDFVSMLVYTL